MRIYRTDYRQWRCPRKTCTTCCSLLYDGQSVEISNRFPMAQNFFLNTCSAAPMKAVFPHTKTVFRILWRENDLRLFAISTLPIFKIFKSRILHDRHGREVCPCLRPAVTFDCYYITTVPFGGDLRYERFILLSCFLR